MRLDDAVMQREPHGRPIARFSICGVALALAAASLQGCAKPHPAAAPVAEAPEALSDSQELEQLRTGGVALTCGSECAAAWAGGRAKVKDLYDAQDWRSLAVAVARIGYKQDLGYYYLGRAAEELRFYEASLSYYRVAVSLSTDGGPEVRCRTKPQQCDGVLLPADVLPRMSIASAEQARARSSAGGRRYGAARYQSAVPRTGAYGAAPSKPGEPPTDDPRTDGGLIDPPPVAPRTAE